MVRFLFADLYAQAELGANGGEASDAPASAQRTDLPSATAAERLAVGDLLPSQVLDAGRLRHGLSHYLHHFFGKKGSRADKRQPSGAALGPQDLPVSLKAVCMLYCFTVSSLKEIRNDMLAGTAVDSVCQVLKRCSL